MAILERKIPENLRVVTTERLYECIGKTIIIRYGDVDTWSVISGFLSCLRSVEGSVAIQVDIGFSLAEIIQAKDIVYFYSTESTEELRQQFGGDALLE